jgi:hypothetical protein
MPHYFSLSSSGTELVKQPSDSPPEEVNDNLDRQNENSKAKDLSQE